MSFALFFFLRTQFFSGCCYLPTPRCFFFSVFTFLFTLTITSLYFYYYYEFFFLLSLRVFSVRCNKKQLQKGAKAKTKISLVWALNAVLFFCIWFIVRCCCCSFFRWFLFSFSTFCSSFFVFFLFIAILFFVLITSVRLMTWSRGYGMCWRKTCKKKTRQVVRCGFVLGEKSNKMCRRV